MTNPFVKAAGNAKEWLFKTYSHDASKMLLHTGTVGWILSATAQVLGIMHNDKLSKDEKKFLIPQETFDAMINILSFYIVTNSLQNFTKRFARTGKVITPEVKAYCEKHGIKIGEWKNDIGKAISEKIDDATKVINEHKSAKNLLTKNGIALPSEAIAKLDTKIVKAEADKKYHEEMLEKFEPFQGGLKMIGNITGAIVSSNLITPLLRNPLAARRQKQDIEREKELSQLYGVNYQQPFKTPEVQSKKPLNSYQPKLTQPTGGMKI